VHRKLTERWRCTNAACASELLIEVDGKLEGPRAICACGAAMKKKYSSPVFSYLEFLRLDEPPTKIRRRILQG
jgi:hypothetical protein